MKQSLLKRSVAQVLLAVLLLVGVGACLGMTTMGAAYADDDAINLRAGDTILGGATISAASTSTLADIQPGDIVQVGTSGVTHNEKTFTYGTSGAAPQWRVLAVEGEGTSKKALLFSENVWTPTFNNSKFQTNSTSKQWYQDLYGSDALKDLKGLVLETTKDGVDTYTIGDGTQTFQDAGLDKDYVFPLSYSEVIQYGQYVAMSKPENTVCLRTTFGESGNTQFAILSNSIQDPSNIVVTGQTDSSACNGRPAFYLDLSKGTSATYAEDESTNVKTWTLVNHTHTFTYAADGATITATCSAEGCTLPSNKATLTIAAPEHAVFDDEKSAAAQITDANGIQGSATVSYFKATKSEGVYTKTGDALGSAPKNAGDYRAEITLGDATAGVGYTIAKAAMPAPSADTAKAKCGIDYAAETATPETGYEVSSDGTTVAPSSLSITAILNGTGEKKVYIRAKAGDDNHDPSDWVEVALTARPGAPTGLGSTNATNSSSANGTITGVGNTMEYSSDGTNWTAVGSEDTTVTGLNPGDYSVRVKATDIAPHGAAATVTVGSNYVALTEANKPTITVSGGHNPPVIGDTLTASTTATDVVYQWCRGGEPIEGATTATYELTTGDVGKAITVRAYQKTDENGTAYAGGDRPMQASDPTAAVVKKQGPGAPASAKAASFVPDYMAETFAVGDTYEVSTSQSGDGVIKNGSLTGALDGTGKVYIRAKETDDTQAGAWLEVALTARPDAPTGLTTEKATDETTADGKIVGTTAAMEYKPKVGEGGWTIASADKTTVKAGVYLVRYKAAEGNPASKTAVAVVGPVQVTVTINGTPTQGMKAGVAIEPEVTGVTYKWYIGDDEDPDGTGAEVVPSKGGGKLKVEVYEDGELIGTGITDVNVKTLHDAIAESNASPVKVKLDGTVDGGDEGIEIPGGKRVELDLNGKQIRGNSIRVPEHSTLTITDSSDPNWGSVGGTVSANTGAVVIEGGKYYNLPAATDPGTVTIEGGYFQDNPSDLLDEEYGVKEMPGTEFPHRVCLRATASDAPKPLLGIAYNGEPHALVTAGTASPGGTMQYALGTAEGPTGAFSEAVPTGTDAGLYHVWYKVVGDADHCDSEPACVDVTIAGTDPDPAVTYACTAGADSTYTKYSGADIAFTFKRIVEGESEDKTFDYFDGVMVDGKAVSEKDSSGNTNYTAAAGSVVVTLKSSYLDTLDPGDHTVTATFKDGGSAAAVITVTATEDADSDGAATKGSDSKGATAKSSSKTSSAKTGDTTPVALLAVSAALSLTLLLAALFAIRMRKGDRRGK